MEITCTRTNRCSNSLKLYMSFSYGMLQKQQHPPPPTKKMNIQPFPIFSRHNLSRVYCRHTPLIFPFLSVFQKKKILKFNIKAFYHPLSQIRTHSVGISDIRRLIC